MPQILEFKEIDGELWCRLGVPGDFPSGVSLWTPEEQESVKAQARREGAEDMRERAADISYQASLNQIAVDSGCSGLAHGIAMKIRKLEV